MLLCAFMLCGSTLCCNYTYAVEFGTVKYNNDYIDYTGFNKAQALKLGDYYFKQAAKSSENLQKKEYLHKAMGQYYILNKLEPDNLYVLVQLARIYDIENKNNFAKAYFFKALDISRNDAFTNYSFGEYYYKREDYKRALDYYNIAFQNGYKENFDVLLKMAQMYEKLGDLLRANQYYKKVYLLNPDKDEIADKIRELESLKYKNTGYYTKKRK